MLQFQTSKEDKADFSLMFSSDDRALAASRIDEDGPITWVWFAPSLAEISRNAFRKVIWSHFRVVSGTINLVRWIGEMPCTMEDPKDSDLCHLALLFSGAWPVEVPFSDPLLFQATPSRVWPKRLSKIDVKSPAASAMDDCGLTLAARMTKPQSKLVENENLQTTSVLCACLGARRGSPPHRESPDLAAYPRVGRPIVASSHA
jgi:hypothetical protein